MNILGQQHEPFAKRATPADADRFAGLNWELGHSGVPLLTDALAALECEIVAEHPTGDHWIVIGRVDNLHISPIKDPLLFFAGGFGTLQQPNQPPVRPLEDCSTPSKGAPTLGRQRVPHRTTTERLAAARFRRSEDFS